jgi:hypothetical protein
MEIVIIMILLTISGIFEAIIDKIQFHYEKSIFPIDSIFWNPQESWKNKYKDDLKTPKYFGSTTFFVMFTDAWHLFKSLSKYFLIGACILIGYYSLIIYVVLFYIYYRIIFEIFFKYILSNEY